MSILVEQLQPGKLYEYSREPTTWFRSEPVIGFGHGFEVSWLQVPSPCVVMFLERLELPNPLVWPSSLDYERWCMLKFLLPTGGVGWLLNSVSGVLEEYRAL